MPIIKLIHPAHGVVAQQVENNYNTEFRIIQTWKQKYGQKFKECTIETEKIKTPAKVIEMDTDEKMTKFNGNQFLGKIVNVITLEEYNTVAEASKDLGISKQKVYNHLYKRLKGCKEDFKYLVRFK